jgi:hypothetical protein
LRLAAALGKAFFVEFAAPFAAGFAACLALGVGTGLAAVTLGTSPSTDLTGQILKIGHFWHPTAMAMGQIVMARTLKQRRYGRLAV